MDNFANYTCVLKITIILSLVTCTRTFLTTPENIGTLTASKLIFLRTYAQGVAAHDVKTVDKSEREYFMDTWENILGNKKNASEMFNRLEKDWKFALDLASHVVINQELPSGNGNKEDITSLVVTMHTKMVAFHQGWCYLLCLMYHKSRKEIKPEHCQNLAAHLLIFSHLGTEELIQKFLSITTNSSKTGESIRNFLHYIRMLPDLCSKYLAINIQSAPEFQEVYSREADVQYDLLLLSLKIDTNQLEYLEGAMECIVLGFPGILFWNKGSQSYVWNLKNLKYSWGAAVNVNQRLLARYNVIDSMREIIVWRAELFNVNRLFFIEDFERKIPDNLQVSFSRDKLENNILYVTMIEV